MSTGNVNGQSQRVCVRIPHDLVAALDKVSDNRSEAVITVLRRALKVKAPKKGAK